MLQINKTIKKWTKNFDEEDELKTGYDAENCTGLAGRGGR